MHELSLAENIVKTVLKTDGVTVNNLQSLHINCGVLSGANIESLKFNLELVGEQSGLEDVDFVIHPTPAKLQCGCGYCYNSDSIFCLCPQCGSSDHEVIDGGEVSIEFVEIIEDG